MVKGKYLNFVLSNIRQSLGQIIAVTLLFVIASSLINTAFFLAVDYKQSFMNEKERLNGEDLDFIFTDPTENVKRSELEDFFHQNENVKAFEITDCFSGKGTAEFKDRILSNTLSFLHFDDALEKSIGKYEILDSDNGSGAYLPYLFQVDAGYTIGDTVSVKIGSEEASFRIAGFYHNIDTGTISCSDTAFLMTDDCFDSIKHMGLPSFRISVLLYDSTQVDLLESALTRDISQKLPSLSLIASSSIKKVSSGRYITATLFEVIIIVSAGLMFTVILSIIAITLSNYIRNSIKTLGTMKAMGYTSRSLIYPIVCEFSVLAFVMSIVGVAGSYLLFPVINTALEQQTGIPYQIHFLPRAGVATIFICILTAAMTSFLSLLKIRKILPINAIRENRTDKKNVRFFSLDKTRFGLNTALALKTWGSGHIRNIVLFIAITGIAFLLGFSCSLYQNIILNHEDVMHLVCGQMTDSVIAVDARLEETLKSELENTDDVDRFYMFSINTITPENLPKMTAYIIDSAENIDAKQVCIEGHLPANDREIAINGMYANLCGLRLGDPLTFSVGEDVAKFTISGITQGAYSTGRDGFITRAGYTRFAALRDVRYYIDLKDDVNIDTFNDSMDDKCPVILIMNFEKSMESNARTYINLLTMATAVMVILSFLIAGFVLYVLISVFLSNKRKEHGILKSLGFVTRDIIFQTVGSLLPTCIIATVLGLWISRRGAASLLTTALNGIGIFSFGTPTRLLFLFVAGLIILLFITAFSILLSTSVRKISTHHLFTNE